jgi:hypothetical protein
VPKPVPVEPRRRDRVAVAAFLLLFLLPMLLRSIAPERASPRWPLLLGKLHDIACLFTHKPEGWSSYYVQVRRVDSSNAEVFWETLDQRELFVLEPFGRRTRMHRLLAAWGAKGSRKTEDMARWIVLRERELHGDRPPPVEIRFARTWMIPSPDEPPQHGWRHPDWSEVPPARRRVIVRYRVDMLFPDGEQLPEGRR